MPIDSRLSYFQKNLFRPFSITEKPEQNLALAIVIPCFNEPDVTSVLNSLSNCDLPNAKTEVILVVNDADNSPKEIREHSLQSIATLQVWKETHSAFFQLQIIDALDLPQRHAGVGLARKIGMDEAASRLEQAGNPSAPIVCLDMDCRVEKNYFTALLSHFNNHPRTHACSIFFEHPLNGDLPDEYYEGITLYELFLRYYVNALRFAGFPFAFQTIGSSMAVRADVYCRMGGMNRRKAGEDFYFLHKIIPLGNFTELNSTTVFPSPRGSDRVPFGTGRAIRTWIEKNESTYHVYDFRTFIDLKIFLARVKDRLYEMEENRLDLFMKEIPESVSAYLGTENFQKDFNEMREHSSEIFTFYKRFFAWFDGLKVLKYVHFARDHFYQAAPLQNEIAKLSKELDIPVFAGTDLRKVLGIFREYDRGNLGIRAR